MAYVELQTTQGDILLVLEVERAPITAGNFLRYAREGRLNGTVFYRAMVLDWAPHPNGLIQGGTQFDPDRILPPSPTNAPATQAFHTAAARSAWRGGNPARQRVISR